MKTELEELRTDLHKMVDEKINALVKPEFKTNVWYKYKHKEVCHQDAFIMSNDLDADSFGLDLSGAWNNKFMPINYLDPKRLSEATPSEVTEALAKEAVKRGFVKGCKVDKSNLPCYSDANKKIWVVNSDTYTLEKCGKFMIGSDWIFENGIWAEIVKGPKTIDEWAKDFEEYHHDTESDPADDFLHFCKANAKELIECLTKLPE